MNAGRHKKDDHDFGTDVAVDADFRFEKSLCGAAMMDVPSGVPLLSLPHTKRE
jgi:hypothetical protein